MARNILPAALALGLLPVLAPAVLADSVDDLIQTQMRQQHIPGLSVAVVRDGKILKEKGYGLADVELNVSATADTVYELGSITKQFTATVIMMLVDEHKVGLDDRVRTYLPNLPAAWDAITVRQLLTHTSGIPNYTSAPGLDARWLADAAPGDVLKTVADAPLDFPPGTKWAYSNTNYFVLGLLLEKISGKPYATLVQERIFRPLQMTATRVNDRADILPHRAKGYSWRDGSLHNAPEISMTWPFAAGALVSTVQDMVKWDAALYTDKLLPQADLTQMWTPATLTDGSKTTYGFGWAVPTLNGHRSVGHDGGIPGFMTSISRFPDDKLTVIVLTNSDTNAPGRLAQDVAARYLPALAPVPEKPIADADPVVTALVKSVLLKTQAGTIDATPFTKPMWDAIYPDRVKAATQALQPLGTLKSLALLGRNPGPDGSRSYRYRAVFGPGALLVTLGLNKDGKIASFGMSGEN